MGGEGGAGGKEIKMEGVGQGAGECFTIIITLALHTMDNVHTH